MCYVCYVRNTQVCLLFASRFFVFLEVDIFLHILRQRGERLDMSCSVGPALPLILIF